MALQPINQPKQFLSKAWLLQGSKSLPGELRLSEERLSFRILGPGNFSLRNFQKLAAKSGQPELSTLLDSSATPILFDLPLSQIERIHFPWYYFLGGLKITLQGAQYRFGFEEPSNIQGASEGGDILGSIRRARKSGKVWKLILRR